MRHTNLHPGGEGKARLLSSQEAEEVRDFSVAEIFLLHRHSRGCVLWKNHHLVWKLLSSEDLPTLPAGHLNQAVQVKSIHTEHKDIHHTNHELSSYSSGHMLHQQLTMKKHDHIHITSPSFYRLLLTVYKGGFFMIFVLILAQFYCVGLVVPFPISLLLLFLEFACDILHHEIWCCLKPQKM